MQCQNLLILWSCSCLGCGNERVICLFRYNTDQYILIGRMWQCSPLIAECVRLKIGDTLLILTSITSKRPLYLHSLDTTIHIHSIDIQYCVCMNCRLHPGVLLHLNFWSAAIHTIWVRDDVALSHSHAFIRQFVACRSSHSCYVDRAQLLHLSLSQHLLLDFHDVPSVISNIWTMCMRSVWRVMQLDTWMNVAWRWSCSQIRHHYWPLVLGHVWHHSLKFC